MSRYKVGDKVIFEGRIYTVHSIEIYVDEFHIFAYYDLLFGGKIKETDIYEEELSPVNITIVTPKQKAISKCDEVNTLLDAYNDYKRLYEMFGDRQYKAKMTRTLTKLKEVR